MKWIISGALAGWAAIVRLAWVLADRRIHICFRADTETACTLRATAARDAVLTGGLTIALLGLIATAAVLRWRRLKLRAPDEAIRVWPRRVK
jgi:hypothetical protein